MPTSPSRFFSSIVPRVAALSLPLFLALPAAAGCSGSDATTGNPTPGDDTGTSGTDTASGDDTATSGDDTGAPPADTGTAPGDTCAPPSDTAAPAGKIQTVFVILMENHSWSTITKSASATYIKSLMGKGAYATNYKTPAGNHPSEPNYIWLEAGGNLGITNDNPPSANHQSVTDHLVSQLETKGISWKTYQEGIDGKTCPLTAAGLYDPKHCPMLFFDNITDSRSATSKHCIDHVRPYTELATDLAAGTVARYNFITPNLCNDMHGETFGTTCPSLTTDMIKKGDTWLSTEVPKILNSSAYKNGGALFITWDEGDESANPLAAASDGPMGMIVLSDFAKVGYASSLAYTHSSTLRTFETIFGVPFLRGAVSSNDLSDMFTAYP
jgi:hypothetical protein